MSRARDLSKLGNPNVIVADTERVGFGTQVPENAANASSSLISAGIVTATAFYGDGSNLEGVASAGLGTAVDDTKDSIGQNIYFTNAELSINENTTVNAPDTSNIAYTQYQQVTVESGSELIIADGDSFIPDVLGIGTALQASTAGAGNGLFGTLYVDNIENVAGRGGPNFPLGITVAGVSTLSGNVSIGGTLTYEDVTNVDSIGVVTARSGIEVTAGGINVGGISTLGGNVKIGSGTPGGKLHIGPIGSGDIVAELTSGSPTFTYRNGSGAWFHAGKHPSQDAFIISDGANTTANERLRIGSAGQIGLGGANYGTSGQVLTSQGGSAAPQWAAVSAGAWSVLTNGTFASGGNSANLYQEITTTHLTSSHKFYKLSINCCMDSSDWLLGLQVQSGGSWKTNGYVYNLLGSRDGTAYDAYRFNQSSIHLGEDNHYSRDYSMEIFFADIDGTSYRKQFKASGVSQNSAAGYQYMSTWATNGIWNGATAITGLRIYAWQSNNSAGNFDHGWYLLEGWSP